MWLHSPAVPRGHSKKLHCLWTGPFTVVKRLSDAVYRIQYIWPRRRRTRVVVHFDHLKLCPPSMRDADGDGALNCCTPTAFHSGVANVPPPAGTHLNVNVEDLNAEDIGPPCTSLY